jgi:hypothetical protein
MIPTTHATLKELEDIEWFRNVGIKDVKPATVVSSWEEAMKHCASLEWENFTLAAANQLRRHIGEVSNERYQRWNDVVDGVKERMIPLVAEKCQAVVEAHRLPKVFIDAVNWDILHLFMECEYSDIVPPAFFAGNAYWYIAGHFPCGWEGEYPAGRPIVY